jgi:hypothetical protein
MRTVDKTYSGFVHGASPHIMGMYYSMLQLASAAGAVLLRSTGDVRRRGRCEGYN